MRFRINNVVLTTNAPTFGSVAGALSHLQHKQPKLAKQPDGNFASSAATWRIEET